MRLSFPARPARPARPGRRPYLPKMPDAAAAALRRAPTIEAVAGGFCLFALWLTLAVGPLRYLSYAIPFVSLVVCLATRRFTLPPNAPPYLLLIATGLALAPLAPPAGFQDLYLMLIGLSPFFFGHRYRLPWFGVFGAMLVATALSLAIGGGLHGAFEFDPTSSRSSFEATSSFVFGALAVWAAMEKRVWPTLLALLLCVLTLKRIVVVGAVATILLLFLPVRWRDLLLRPIPMILLNALYLWVVIAYTQGALDRTIADLTHQSANQLGMGRQSIYHYPVAELLAHPFQYAFYGGGPGSVYDLMKGGWSFLAKLNLHNDSLKVLVDYGGVVWLGFFTLLYWPKDLRVRTMAAFVNVLLLTDNVLIYPYMIFTVGMCLVNLQDGPLPARAPRRRRWQRLPDPPPRAAAVPGAGAGVAR